MLRAIIGTTIVAGALLATGLNQGPGMTLAGSHGKPDPPCTVSAAQDPSSGYWWLDVSASGLSPSSWYSVFAVQPDGQQIGTAAYSDASGYLDTTSLMAMYPGVYDVTLHHFHSGSVLGSCSTTVP
jgi:hypothetical protein